MRFGKAPFYSPNLGNPALITSFGLFDSAANDLRSFCWRDEMLRALEQTRPGPVAAAGGAMEYVRQGGLTDQQIHANWFGNYAEFVRNRIEHTDTNPDPHAPVVDRYGPNHETIQDYAGNGPISAYVHNKLEDDPADRHQVTDQYHERLEHYHGKFESIVHGNEIVPDSDKIGIKTSAHYYQSQAEHSRDYITHPFEQGLTDISEHEAAAIIIYSAYFLGTEVITSGQFTTDSLYNLAKILPSYGFRYTAMTGFEMLGFATISQFETIGHFTGEQFANLHQDIIAPGLGFIFIQAWNIGKMSAGKMEWYQFKRSFVSSSTATVAFFVFSSVGSAAAAGAGVGTATCPVIGTAVGFVAGLSVSSFFAIRNIMGLAQYENDRILVMIESQKAMFLPRPDSLRLTLSS